MREFCCVVEEGKKGVTCLRLIYCNNHVLIRLKAECHKTHREIASARDCRNNYSKKKKVVWLQTRLALVKKSRVRCSFSPTRFMLTIMWVSTIYKSLPTVFIDLSGFCRFGVK